MLLLYLEYLNRPSIVVGACINEVILLGLLLHKLLFSLFIFAHLIGRLFNWLLLKNTALIRCLHAPKFPILTIHCLLIVNQHCSKGLEGLCLFGRGGRKHILIFIGLIKLPVQRLHGLFHWFEFLLLLKNILLEGD